MPTLVFRQTKDYSYNFVKHRAYHRSNTLKTSEYSPMRHEVMKSPFKEKPVLKQHSTEVLDRFCRTILAVIGSNTCRSFQNGRVFAFNRSHSLT